MLVVNWRLKNKENLEMSIKYCSRKNRRIALSVAGMGSVKKYNREAQNTTVEERNVKHGLHD